MRRGGLWCAGAQWPIELNGSMKARGRSLKRNDALSDGMVRQIGGWAGRTTVGRCPMRRSCRYTRLISIAPSQP